LAETADQMFSSNSGANFSPSNPGGFGNGIIPENLRGAGGPPLIGQAAAGGSGGPPIGRGRGIRPLSMDDNRNQQQPQPPTVPAAVATGQVEQVNLQSNPPVRGRGRGIRPLDLTEFDELPQPPKVEQPQQQQQQQPAWYEPQNPQQQWRQRSSRPHQPWRKQSPRLQQQQQQGRHYQQQQQVQALSPEDLEFVTSHSLRSIALNCDTNFAGQSLEIRSVALELLLDRERRLAVAANSS
ncbi:hypothetical protein BOX15_Mlig004559g2, partial [Macrostomum lignano]